MRDIFFLIIPLCKKLFEAEKVKWRFLSNALDWRKKGTDSNLFRDQKNEQEYERVIFPKPVFILSSSTYVEKNI